ncbi:MAG: hypothetical protein EAZ06_09460 [Cytophagales bacterium]|nr:MAG: hypothetical protein EAZ06_09460 [Cytophagales bacterium]
MKILKSIDNFKGMVINKNQMKNILGGGDSERTVVCATGHDPGERCDEKTTIFCDEGCSKKWILVSEKELYCD